MKEKWKNFSKQEKTLIIIIVILTIAVIINWNRIYKGASKGFDNYKKEIPTNDTAIVDKFK